MHFLMKLRADYEVVRANILNRGTLPEIDFILGELLREETRLTTQTTLEQKKDDVVFFTNKTKSKPSSRDFSHVQCYECKATGHTASHCKKRNFCVYYKKGGHIISECKVKPPRTFTSSPRTVQPRAYQASETQSSGPSSLDSEKNNVPTTVGVSDEVRQLVQSSVTSAISSAFSVIGLSGKVSFYRILSFHITAIQ
ncbi:uncharacterized protein LOC122067733 isoform X2 [Macadamia integrifolia]|nr:uncharacterized protein LOC122067733 isoform X2 [Macadamia integrifolia]